MEKQVLSIEQMQHLKELGVDTSQASGNVYTVSESKIFCGLSRDIVVIDGYLNEWLDNRKSFTLQDILNLIPKTIKYNKYTYVIDFWYNALFDEWCIGYSDGNISYGKTFRNLTIIDAAYDILCWCADNGHLKSK